MRRSPVGSSEILEIRFGTKSWGCLMETYICKKCGEELYLDDIENWGERKCPECDEPIPWNLAEDELRDLRGDP